MIHCILNDASVVQSIISVTGTLLGIIIGFLLGEGSRLYREKIRIRKLKKILKEELESIQKQIPCKEKVVKEAIEEMNTNGNFINPSSVKFITTCYQTHVSELYEHLSENQRGALHLIYEQLEEADNILIGTESLFFEAIKNKHLGDPLKLCKDRLDNVLTNYGGISDMIDKHLKGEKFDPFVIQ